MKAEKFIEERTRNCSNELCAVEDRFGKKVISYHEWLTPDQARMAVEIAREEIYEWLRVNLCDYFDAPREDYDMCLDDLKQAMKDETQNL